MNRNLQIIQSLLPTFLVSKSYHSNNFYYRSLFSQYYNHKPYLELLKTCSTSNSIKTDVEIRFNKTVAFGCTLKNAKQSIGVSNYHTHKNSELNTTILLFRILFGNHKVKCQMHFYNNTLFFFSYNFSAVNSSEINELKKIIQEKYLYGVDCENGTNIIDSSNNCINIENNAVFSINYLSMDSNFFNTLTVKVLMQKEKYTHLTTKHAEQLYSWL